MLGFLRRKRRNKAGDKHAPANRPAESPQVNSTNAANKAEKSIPRKADMTTAAHESGDVFIGRLPILNNSQRIFGYELIFRNTGSRSTENMSSDAETVGRYLINTFNNIGLEKVLEGRRAFVHVTEQLLHSDVLEALPREIVVILLAQGIEPNAEVIGRVEDLKIAGYHIALDKFVYQPDIEPLLRFTSYLKLDIGTQGAHNAADLMKKLRGRGLSFIAQGLDSQEDYETCRHEMFNFYQGYYFSHPETVKMKRVDPKSTLIMNIYNLVRQGAKEIQIEEQFKKDVALSFQLLRYINSAGMGLSYKIDSIKRALVIIGKEKLVRWLSLLLISPSNNSELPNALFKTALARARMAELLAENRLNESEKDQVFLAGMFSLLDAAFSMPLDQLLNSMNLPDVVSRALLTRSGPIAPFLMLSEAAEKTDIDQITVLASKLDLSIEQISHAHMEALTWAEGLT